MAVSNRPAVAEVDLGAVRHNVGLLRDVATPAAVCAVVKADGYGHGAVPVATAALEAGASWLAVAMAEEARPLREAGIDAPILVLAEPAPDELDDIVALDLRPAVYSTDGIEGLAKAVARAGRRTALPVHLKVDTGMHRVGVRPEDAAARVAAIADRPELALEAVWTHCPVADEPGNPFTDAQADRFDAVLAALPTRPPLVHGANSAATIDHPRMRHDLVRCGIAVYGLAPSPALDGRLPLRPAMSVKARIGHVQRIAAGEAVSYGLRRPAPVDTVVATVPLGYADGVPRRLGEVGGEVLVGGRRCPLAGTVTMDQLLVDCGPESAVAVGDEAVLLGVQGDERVTADEWARLLGTINYEIVCGISPRVPRRYVG